MKPRNFSVFGSNDVVASDNDYSQFNSDLLSENRAYSCPSCLKVYKAKSSLNLHLRLECGKEPKFSCPFCPKKSHQKGNLKVHILTKHKDEMKTSSHLFAKYFL